MPADVVYRSDFWEVTTVGPPVKGAEYHWLLTPLKEPALLAEGVVGLGPVTQDDYWRVLDWLRNRYRLDHYCTATRSWEGGRVHVVVSPPRPASVRFEFGDPPVEVPGG